MTGKGITPAEPGEEPFSGSSKEGWCRDNHKSRLTRCSTRIQSVLQRLRRESRVQDDGRTHIALIRTSSNPSSPDRVVIGIPSKGCSYARTKWGGCSVCGHVASPLWNHQITSDVILDDFRGSLALAQAGSARTVCLYTSGSFPDPSEVPLEIRSSVLSETAKIPSIQDLWIESLPQFLSASFLDEAREILGPRVRLRVGMGLDTADDTLRSVLFQRHIRFAAYQSAVDRCRSRGVDTEAYLVLGHPLLDPTYWATDAASSVERAFEAGFAAVSLEPVAMQPATIQWALEKVGHLVSPSIWDIVDTLRACPPGVRESGRILLGGQVFTPIPTRTLAACPECLSMARLRAPWVSDAFWKSLPVSYGQACCESRTSARPSRPCAAVGGSTPIGGLLDYAESLLQIIDSKGMGPSPTYTGNTHGTL